MPGATPARAQRRGVRVPASASRSETADGAQRLRDNGRTGSRRQSCALRGVPSILRTAKRIDRPGARWDDVTMSESWRDPTAAWWAKAARALKHIRDADSVASAYESAKPYEIRQEATDRPGEVAFRFRLLKPPPVELLTIIGDAIHNMRSSLDSVAFELARQQLGDTMTDRQERAAQFPIAQDRAEFDDFFDSHKFRRQMYGQRERDTMRCVQPFAIREEAAAYGVDWATSPEEEYRINELAR